VPSGECTLHPADESVAWLLLLRHAPSAWNAAHRRQGWADPPLTEPARMSVHRWAIPGCLRAAVSSDLQRARTTAALIAERAGWGPVATHRALREQDQGAWTGLTKAQITQRWPDALRERPRRPLSGETIDAVRERVVVALTRIARQHAGQCTLVVTHLEVIRVFERTLGVDAPTVPHLEGRWLRIEPGQEATPVTLAAGEPTAGRYGTAAVEST
jgi:broad specificity phosphatase PhoE